MDGIKRHLRHHRQTFLWMGLLCGLVGGLVSPSQAEAKEEYSIKDARRFYITGMRYYHKGKYTVAEAQLALASRLLPTTKRYAKAHRRLRYYLGICYVKLKQYRKAKRQLEHFLKTSKDASRRKKAQALLVKVNRKVAAMPSPKRETAPAPRPRQTIVVVPKERTQPKPRTRKVKVVVVKDRRQPPPQAPPQMRWQAWPFIVMGVGVGGLIAGGVFGYLTNDALQQRDQTYDTLAQGMTPANPPLGIEIAIHHRKAENMALIANASFIGGGVLTATGLILVLTVGRVPVQKTSISRRFSQQQMTTSMGVFGQ